MVRLFLKTYIECVESEYIVGHMLTCSISINTMENPAVNYTLIVILRMALWCFKEQALAAGNPKLNYSMYVPTCVCTCIHIINVQEGINAFDTLVFQRTNSL